MVDEDERTPPGIEPRVADGETTERVGELGRLISLSDAVFAFAMTLLIVSVEVPRIPDNEARTHLLREVGALWPQILSYVIGFLVIGFLWSSHRRIFTRLRDFDEVVTRQNLVLLMLIAFLPFPTGILGEYGNLAFASIFYACVLATVSLLYIVILDHLDRHRELLSRNGKGYDFARAKTRHLVTAAIFLLSIPVALALPGAAQLVWILLAFNHKVSERILPYMPARFQERGQS